MKNIATYEIRKIINAWDPIGLLEFAPADEYYPEIREIEAKIFLNCDAEFLGKEIFLIFSKYFGDVFSKTIEECIEIACLILQNG